MVVVITFQVMLAGGVGDLLDDLGLFLARLRDCFAYFFICYPFATIGMIIGVGVEGVYEGIGVRSIVFDVFGLRLVAQPDEACYYAIGEAT